MQRKNRWMAICLAAGLCGGTAAATTITGTDNASWTNAIVASTQQSLTLGSCGVPCALGGFTFTATGDVYYSNITYGHLIYGLLTHTTSHTMTVTMASPGETAVYLNLFNYNAGYSGGGDIEIDLANQTFTTLSGNVFWFASSDPITSFTITSNNQPFIAQLDYAESIAAASGSGSGTGSPSPVPEPATILLVSGGALIFFGARRRWFRREA